MEPMELTLDLPRGPSRDFIRKIVDKASSKLNEKMAKTPLPPGFHWGFEASDAHEEGENYVATVTARPRLTVYFED